MKIGDTVKLSDLGKKEYPDARNNPHNLQGELFKPSALLKQFIYKVKWDNGAINVYQEGELEKGDNK